MVTVTFLAVRHRKRVKKVTVTFLAKRRGKRVTVTFLGGATRKNGDCHLFRSLWMKRRGKRVTVTYYFNFEKSPLTAARRTQR